MERVVGGAADKDNQTHGTTFSWVLGVRSTEITEREIFYSSEVYGTIHRH